jgi:hypothetical protein
MSKITTTTELERVHLRFLKVPDNQKLSEILGKLLPNILKIYFENDLINAVMSQDNPKIKALEEIVNHLLMKVMNSKGEVKIPFAKLIDIFDSDVYFHFQNPQIKAHGKNRIFDFLFASYKYLPHSIDNDSENIF